MYLPKDASLPVTLKSREYEVFTVVPVKELRGGVKFAPIGLLKMFNSGGAIKQVDYYEHSEQRSTAKVVMRVCGCGILGAYSSTVPKKITVGSESESEGVEFGYEQGTGLITVALSVAEQELYLWNITITY